MRVVVIYRPNSEHGTRTEQFIRDFQRRYNDLHLEVLNIDTRDGSAMASLYDVMQYPAILVLQNDGYVQNVWQGDALPLMDEIFAYAHV